MLGRAFQLLSHQIWFLSMSLAFFQFFAACYLFMLFLILAAISPIAICQMPDVISIWHVTQGTRHKYAHRGQVRQTAKGAGRGRDGRGTTQKCCKWMRVKKPAILNCRCRRGCRFFWHELLDCQLYWARMKSPRIFCLHFYFRFYFYFLSRVRLSWVEWKACCALDVYVSSSWRFILFYCWRSFK